MWLYITGTAVVVLASSAYIALIILSPSPQTSSPPEKNYVSAHSPKKPLPLPSLTDPASCGLSVVIPAYNETVRLPIMLEEALLYLESNHCSTSHDIAAAPDGKHGYEVLIVDDGSSDATSSEALDLASRHPQCDIRVVTLRKNRGKGGAVKHGVMHARGARVLFVDADGASKFADLGKLWVECERLEKESHGWGAAVGSRAHLVGTEAVVKRKFIRNILMHGLHFLLRTLGVGHIRDTQCGFKLFSRKTAQTIFPPLHLHSWIFDVELLLLCSMLSIPVAEVPIAWHEVSGSKINLVWDSVGMLRDLVVVRANYAFGRWRIPQRPIALPNVPCA